MHCQPGIIQNRVNGINDGTRLHLEVVQSSGLQHFWLLCVDLQAVCQSGPSLITACTPKSLSHLDCHLALEGAW